MGVMVKEMDRSNIRYVKSRSEHVLHQDGGLI